MRILRLEWKKYFRPGRLLLVFALLCCFCIAVSRSQRKAVSLTDTASYPEQITIYDTVYGWRSIDLLFHDYLLNAYGGVITKQDVPKLSAEREYLLEQIIAASEQDPVLLRNGVMFYPDWETFGSEYQEDATEPSEEDNVYIWSLVNGQMQMQGTDHPVGFLSKYQTVIDRVESNGVYHVMSYDLIAILKDNFLIVIVFSCGTLLLTVPYGVLEAKSRTEGLSAATKTGRRHYAKKLTAAVLAAALVIGLGILLAVLAFSQWKVSRYYGCDVGDAMDICWDISSWKGVTFGAYYGLRLLLLFLLGLCVNILAAILSLRLSNSVTAIACILPLALLLLAYHLAYNAPSIGFLEPFDTSGHPHEVAAGLFLLTVGITAAKLWTGKRKDIRVS